MDTQKQLYLIDGSAYLYRAYHAIRSLSNATGFPTNAIFGFTRMLLKLMEERTPPYVGMFFDAKGPTFRHAVYADYKANRPPMPDDLAMQIPPVKAVTEAFRIPVIEMGGYEADDLIGTTARQAAAAGFDVTIVTGDKDFVQLLTERITIWDPMKDKDIGMRDITATNGVSPPQMIDVMGLSGDTADNVPGVPGIGPKTALKLIQSYHSLEGVYAHIEEIKGAKQKENLLAFKDQALLSRDLVTICTEAPIAFDPEVYRASAPDEAKLAAICQTYEFRQLQQRFTAPTEGPAKHYHGIMDTEALAQLVAQLARAERVALDTETTSQDPMRAELVGLSFAIAPHEAYYIPCGHRYLGAPSQMTCNDVLATLKPILENPAIAKIGQNIKYDWMVLSRHGVDLQGVRFDTMVASYLLNPSKRSHSLDQIAMDFLGHKTITYAEVVGKGSKKAGFEAVPVEQAIPYAAEDADITLMAYEALRPQLEELGLMDLFDNVEMPLVPVLLRMEMAGITVDQDRLRELSKSFAAQLEALETSIHALAGEPFNIKSSQQLGRILFEKLALPVQKKTKKKTGYSTDVGVLTTLAEHHELPALVLRHRGLAKLKSTYVDALMEMVHPTTRRIHTSYNQSVTATGRLSSSDPNLQNIPIRTEEGREIRKAFIPRPGWKLLAADYSQVELRILAHYAQDDTLISAFASDQDIHTRTACEVFETSEEMISDELRRHAKVINFGIIYGMGPYSLAQDLGISQAMAKTYIDNYFNHYPGVKAFIDQTIETARQTKQTSTLMGRIRLLPDIDSRNHNVRQFAERTAVNTPIQGTAADLIKLAMIAVDRQLREASRHAVMLLSVHDEIVLEVPPPEIEAVSAMVQTTMEGIWELAVPLKVNLAVGDNWNEAH
ncbi:MAG: DNA polymerase I [Desulfobacteraceae bacterium]|nr:DNA polymerase I [Desulfobacteraceae bacterium]MBC2752093.1 DNA polymerase I [Desulfobacteraceae bacterium]